jgi:sugar phosphate isomerase/epimerase
VVTRRTFLSALTTAAAAAAARVRAAAPYRVGLETYCFHDVDLTATLRHTTQLGLRFVELHDGHLPFASSDAELAGAKEALRQAGVTPAGVYIHDAFSDSEQVARPIFSYARTMGFEYINGGPDRSALPLLNRLVPEYGIDIAVHNHGPKSRYETLDQVMAVLEAHPNLTACVDIGHFARSRVDPVRAIRAIGRRSIAVHVKDVDSAGGNTVLGDGTIDLPGVFAALAETRFDGLLVLEYEGDFDDMEARLEGMRKSLRVMESLVADAARRRQPA